MVSSLGPSAWDTMQSFRTSRSFGAAQGLANSSAMTSQIFGVDPSTNAALSIFGIDTGNADSLFAATNEGIEASMTIAMARAAWARDTPSKADEATTKALNGGGLGGNFDFFA
ncbi:hypothetical protein [Phreatobacter sp.]|uniref:hypothetical protein n=1 Tax=Phreatobacter sp. TaxID=1966341 RepID=UPI0025FE284E|nr:hypothetical protein [Phreatobacter sp.]